ncbi:hypothetical protein Barb7_02317 [Bacteroidales bacterium Barb7]|nr:hypothetical protein Barb7_02317 [Bacteroidales bacterium Barb7]
MIAASQPPLFVSTKSSVLLPSIILLKSDVDKPDSVCLSFITGMMYQFFLKLRDKNIHKSTNTALSKHIISRAKYVIKHIF